MKKMKIFTPDGFTLYFYTFEQGYSMITLTKQKKNMLPQMTC